MVQAAPATTAAKADANAAQYKTIGEMQALKGTPEAIFRGTCIAQGWRPGKMVTEKEYDAAVASFGSAPMGGKRGGRNA